MIRVVWRECTLTLGEDLQVLACSREGGLSPAGIDRFLLQLTGSKVSTLGASVARGALGGKPCWARITTWS
jgi:hypothetical protein